MERLISVENVSKEVGADRPKVDILFGPHVKKADQIPARELFESSDVFIPEHPYWNNELKDAYNKVSQGEITVEDGLKLVRKYTNFPTFEKAQLEMVHGSNKPIIFADLNTTEPEVESMFQSLNSLQEAYIQMLVNEKEFAEAIADLRSAVRDFVKVQKEREGKIAENLEKILDEAGKDLPQLKNKQEVKILMTLGGAHTGLYHLLRGKNISVKAEFPQMPYLFGFNAELGRRGIFEKEISEGLLAKAVLDGAVKTILRQNVKNLSRVSTSQIENFTRIVLDKFSESEAVDLLKKFRQIANLQKVEYLKSQLEARNINFPKTAKELLSLIN